MQHVCAGSYTAAVVRRAHFCSCRSIHCCYCHYQPLHPASASSATDVYPPVCEPHACQEPSRCPVFLRRIPSRLRSADSFLLLLLLLILHRTTSLFLSILKKPRKPHRNIVPRWLNLKGLPVNAKSQLRCLLTSPSNQKSSPQVWFQNRRAKFRRNERSSAINRGVSSAREMETTLPLRPIRVTHTQENTTESLQTPQVAQYPYSDYWRSSQHYASMQATTTCHGFINGNLGNVNLPSYHQSEIHGGLEGSTMNGLNALRFRTHPYGTAYPAMHASM